MRVLETIETRIEIREFKKKDVDKEIKLRILEAGRLAPSGLNVQHWHYIIIEGGDELKKLSDVSPTGKWVSGSNFAVVTVTDPKYKFNEIDAGRAISQMQLVAWDNGIGSRLYTIKIKDQKKAKSLLKIPEEYDLTAVVGFGYPIKKIKGRKQRKEMNEVVSQNEFGKIWEF